MIKIKLKSVEQDKLNKKSVDYVNEKCSNVLITTTLARALAFIYFYLDY